jgi:hypothetical protein
MAQPITSARVLPRRRWRYGLTAIALAVLVGAAWYWLAAGVAPPTVQVPPEPDKTVNGPPWLRDVTASSDVAFTFRTGEEAGHLTILEAMGGGVALIDYDGDGLLDIFLTGGGYFDRARTDDPEDAGAYEKAVRQAPPGIHGHPCKLYRNLGG